MDESKLMKSEATLALFMRPWSGAPKTQRPMGLDLPSCIEDRRAPLYFDFL